MSGMTAEQAKFLFEFMAPSIKNEHRVTRSVIEAIPATNSDHRPDANSKTAMELAWHIAAAEQRFYAGIVNGVFDFTPMHKPENFTTSAQIATWYGDNFDKNFAAMTKLSGEQLAKIMDFRGMFQLPAVAYTQFTLHHGIHHRGQLSTYLRAMGGQVPAIYGESYDSAMKKSAQA